MDVDELTLGEYCLKSLSSGRGRAFTAFRFPSPATRIFTPMASFTCESLRSVVTVRLKLPTAPEKPAGREVAGSGCTSIAMGSVRLVIVSVGVKKNDSIGSRLRRRTWI